MDSKPLTIGELAKRANVATSLLRYYEKENLLSPSGRTDSGYRVYSQDAERRLRFIRSAQRYGFSLDDIRNIIGADKNNSEHGSEIMHTAQKRFIDIERRLTEMLVLRHELELFIEDLGIKFDGSSSEIGEHYRELVEQVCGPEHHQHKQSSLNKLVARLRSSLTDKEWQSVFKKLRSQHLHIWRDDNSYSIQFTSFDESIKQALETIVGGEQAYDGHNQSEVINTEEGVLFRAHGDRAFLYAQLFLALESE